ncbi:MAG: hypothetical protein KAS23_10730 [Anaerohalosphaera sp.]|nr:hypothetical protein [Anaerohalosphaera sp.]
MTIKNQGYALIEMLIISAVLVVFIGLSVRPLRMIISEIPRSGRIYQTWNTTTEAIKQLKNDVEQCSRIIGFDNGQLTLEHVDNQVTYMFSDGKISRKASPDESESVWSIPHVKVNTQLWKNDSGHYAVEITTWNEQTVTDRKQKRLRQSFVYFQKESSQVQ